MPVQHQVTGARTYVAFLRPTDPYALVWRASTPLGTVIARTGAAARAFARARWPGVSRERLRVTPAGNPPAGFLGRALAHDGAALR